jgi:outer membrane protein
MKRTVFGLVLILVSLALGAGMGTAADVAKIGVVDFQRFLTESQIGQTAQAEIETEGARMEKELKEQGGAIEALEKKMEADAMVVSEEKRESQLREYRIKVGDLKALQQKYTVALKKLEQELIARVQQQAAALAAELGKKDGYLLLIEKNAVIYYPSAIDATDDLIQFANAKAGALAPAAGNQP